MSLVEQNKAILNRYMTAVNNHTVMDVLDLFADNFTDSSAPPGMPSGKEGFLAAHQVLETAFPDVRFTIDKVIAEGDKIGVVATGSGTNAGPFFGIPATGKTVTWWGVRLLRIENGKIAEAWGVFDQMGILQQMGVIPP
ncbi:MAG: ester cyclase [Anaerolineae bacterium]|nr:ester cyclase [Anaerolineae bacterium]NUQ07205.1 ester cyclase [Anaerolineae bacterium]